jgi:hypothetical protein
MLCELVGRYHCFVGTYFLLEDGFSMFLRNGYPIRDHTALQSRRPTQTCEWEPGILEMRNQMARSSTNEISAAFARYHRASKLQTAERIKHFGYYLWHLRLQKQPAATHAQKTNRIQKQALECKLLRQRDPGRPKERWRDQRHLGVADYQGLI